MAGEQRKSPRKRSPRAASDAVKPAKRTSGAAKPAKRNSANGDDGGGTAERGRSRKRTAPRPVRRRGSVEDGHREERGESVEAHAAFVVSHFGGGAEATPAILDRAIQVWQRLPGAIVGGAALVRPNRPATPPGREEPEEQ